jgi:2-keto-4-pentenoate hydratase
MSNDEIDAIAQQLNRAYEQGSLLAAAPSSQTGIDLEAAYAVEAKLRELREARGHKAVGRKVGHANKAVWRIFKLETLVWAHMYNDTVHDAENNSATLHLSHARSLKIEPEIVFGMER